ncbi:hypothetical protein OYC64_007578 [Pagothenia borchgrevinki]|uniref:Ig-like domain-containing protein n=1 Tax=Pagothenia borchgrevinki TaxID=8213 RepID=A0ABD2GSY8_PAGBO
MNTDGWMFLVALRFICVTSNDEPYNKTSCVKDPDVCETHRLSTQLGSSVLLPCNFKPSNVTWVSWSQTPDLHLLQLTSAGRIVFLNPRSGRVKAFPNQGQEENFSISINELNNSDLGCYVCTRGDDCLQVELVAEHGAQSVNMMLLIYISAGVAAFILLSVGGYCCMKFCCKNTASYNPEGAGTEGVSPSQEETGRVPVGQQQGGADNHSLVYENEDQGPFNQQEEPGDYCNTVSGAMPHPDLTLHPDSSSGMYPNLNQFQRTESQRTKLRFHRELFNRLRQASVKRPYYVNQDEMRQQQASSTQEEKRRRGLGKKKAKENAEFKNPIYNRSVDQLNHL